MKLKLGDKLYLNLQLYTGNNDGNHRVFVELRDEDGILIKPAFEINHVGSGEFRESTETMPSDRMITASFFVYQSDGVTLDTTFSVSKDVYMRDFTAEIVSYNLDAKVSGAGIADLIGSVVEETVITGEFPLDEILSAEILETILTGDICEC